MRSVIGEHPRAAGPLERHQRFEHQRIALPRAGSNRRFDHRIFAAHLIGKHRNLEPLLHPPHDVEIGQARLDHDAVGPLGNVERDLAQRLFGIGWVHLIGLLVALQQSTRAHGIAEWAVKGAGIFRGIAHDLDIGVPVHLQRHADRLDPPVHHVGWGDDVSARFCLVERLIDQYRHGIVIHHIAGIIHQPVLPVRGIGIERDIGEDAHIIAARITNRADRAAHQIVRVERFLSIVAAPVGRCVGEQRHAGDSQVHCLPGAFGDSIHRPARDAGQGRNRLFHAGPCGDEQRPDQVRRGEHIFAVQRTAPAAGTGAAQAQIGVGSIHAGECCRIIAGRATISEFRACCRSVRSRAAALRSLRGVARGLQGQRPARSLSSASAARKFNNSRPSSCARLTNCTLRGSSARPPRYIS